MTTVSLIEYNPDNGPLHSPSTSTKGLDKTKVAKVDINVLFKEYLKRY